MVAAGAIVLGYTTAARTETVSLQTPCGKAQMDRDAPSLRVVGNHMETTDGHVVVPYGISLVGGPETVFWVRAEQAAIAQIIAARRYWHANAVRIQVSEAQLLDHPTPKHSYNVPFAASVNRVVCKALAERLIPIINDTTLFTTKSRGPTERSVRFWNFMSQRYGNRLPIIFDVFDEPRLGRNPRTNNFFALPYVWKLWERGGGIAGKRYIGMQALIDAIRVESHVQNVIWAEEPWFLDPEALPTAQLPQHLLKGSNIVYAFHKVTLDAGSRSFKALSAVTGQGVPMVDSEWSQFAAADRPWECQDNAYGGMPGFLDLLSQRQIGLMAWSLQPGALVRGVPGVETVHDGNDFRFTSNPAALATPNVMKPDYGCNTASLGQGAGTFIQDFFKQQSHAAPASLFPRF